MNDIVYSAKKYSKKVIVDQSAGSMFLMLSNKFDLESFNTIDGIMKHVNLKRCLHLIKYVMNLQI